MGTFMQEDLALTGLEAQLHKLRTGAGFLFRTKETSRILYSGADALDLLQRISTAELNDMQIGETRQTAVITAGGRIVDLFAVLRRSEDSFLLTSDLQDPSKLIESIDKYAIIEDVSFQNLSPVTGQVTVVGPEVSNVLEEVVDIDGVEALHLQWPESMPRWEVVFPIDSKESIKSAFSQAADPVSSKAFTLFRIEKMLPLAGSDLDERVNPLEAGAREPVVSFDKGCYVGQEVVARLDTYDKVQRKLVRLKCKRTPKGASILAGDIQVGWTCSSEVVAGETGQEEGRALGFVRGKFLNSGDPLTIDGEPALVW